MMILRFLARATVIMVVSSANCSTVVETVGREIRSLCIRLNIVCRISVVKMNKCGESGSPYRNHHL
jgi:hypothetical protein